MFFLILCDSSIAATKQVIAGAGPSTKIVQLFADSFSKLPEADGIESGVSLGLVYDLKNSNNSVVQATKKYASSKEWKNIVIQNGLLPPN